MLCTSSRIYSHYSAVGSAYKRLFTICSCVPQELNLCGNEMHRSGAQKVAEALVGKSRLRREGLALDENELGEEGIELLRSTLEAAGLSHVFAPIEYLNLYVLVQWLTSSYILVLYSYSTLLNLVLCLLYSSSSLAS